MEFIVAPAGPENGEREYWIGYRTSIIEIHARFEKSADVFSRDYVRPIECDAISDSAEELKKIYEEGVSTAKSDPFDDSVNVRTKPYKLFVDLFHGISETEELMKCVDSFRSVCLGNNNQTLDRLTEVRQKIGSVDKDQQKLIEDLDKHISTI